MDNFDKIIKQKVEQFEVPYNEAHWAEMDQKLNSIRAAKIKKTIFGSAAIIAIIAISSYFIFSNNETSTKNNNNIIANDSTTEAVINDAINPKKENTTAISSNKIVNENVLINENNLEASEIEIPAEENNNKTQVADNSIVKDEKENSNVPDKIETTNNTVNTDFIVYNNKVCLGEEVSFESSENDEPVSYKWNFGDGTISYEANPKHVYKDSRVYTVSLSLLNRRTGVEYPSSIQYDVVTILPMPKVNFSYSEVSIKHDDNKLKYPYTTFKIKETHQQNTYKWDFGNGETSTSVNGKTIYEKKGNYTTTLIVKTLNGCVKSTTKKVTIKNGTDLFVENAFSPNGDADNETFIPKALLKWDVQFEMTIIDKSGSLVYKTSDRNEPWNGKMNNSGKVLNEGIYLWKVVTYDAEGTPHTHHDQIHLIK